MSVNLLAVSVGNTRVQLGVFVDGELSRVERLAPEALSTAGTLLEQLYEPIRDVADAAVYLASVDPDAAERVTGVIEDTLGVTAQRVERDVTVPVGRQLDPEAIPGEDRLLNAAAAYDRAKGACVVIDAGTAITVDYIDGAGTFHGGAILPGAQMMLDAMHRHTAQLPEVKLAQPDEAIGHNTVQAMLGGVFHGIRGAMRGLVEAYAIATGAYPRVIATGGDAELLFKTDELVESILPDLTLQGLALTRRAALDADD